MEETSATTPKIITWSSNFNNKLGCQAFVHVDRAPAINPTRDQVNRSLFEIRTADMSHPPVRAKCEDLLIFRCDQLNDFISWVSHGMQALDLIDLLFKIYHPNFSLETMVAIYFYKKID